MPAFLCLLGLVIGVMLGANGNQSVNAKQCEKLGAFYVDDTVYACHPITPQPVGEQPDNKKPR